MSMATHWKHNVFLSFRGKDTRKTFTDHLYTALVQAGILTFRDNDELSSGKEISLELLKAIEESQISIIVISKNYASSRWCLDELVKIIECMKTMGQLVLPVFYDVNPSEVRRQTGSFAEAFACHEKRYAAETGLVQTWRTALVEAANLSGWDLQNVANGYESKFIQKIVEKVLREVKHKYLNVVEFPVGIDSRVKDISRLLRIASDDVRIVGIYGMGGVGKTTTAKALCNSIFQHFECSYFAENVSEFSEQPNGLVSLQEKILAKILNRENVKIDNIDHGINLMKERLRPRKVLLVLDDLDKLSQVTSLVGHRNWFGSGSRIIVTTRNEHLLNQVQVDARYKVEELNFDQSLELFSWHAFKKTAPLEDYVELSKDIVRYTGGLPLALQTIGSSLVGRSVEMWKTSFEMLQKNPDTQIQEKFKISFDALDHYTKEVFLDIACFFIGMHKDDAITILNACGFFPERGISILMERCLLTINERNELRMHDLLRDIGREIVHKESVKEPGRRSRLCFQEDVRDVLMKYKGTKAVEGIILEQPTSEPISLSTKTFEKMKRLRLLKLNNAHLSGNFENIFQELRWLCMHHSHLMCLPSDLDLEKLVVLDMQYSKLSRVWDGIKVLQSLKTLNLSHSQFLTTTPDFTRATNVERLLLKDCTSLTDIHPSIGCLTKMVHLDLSECKKLGDLPDNFCNLISLERLELNQCSSLVRLPKNIGKLESLRSFTADYTPIRQIPNSIGYLKNLENLSFQGCTRTLPAKSWFSRIFSPILPQRSKPKSFLPPSISGLSSLKRLNLDCSNLSDEDIDELGNLSSLEQLYLGGNNFRKLPLSLGQLPALEILWLVNCTSLESLPELPSSLISLHIDGCTSMVTLPDLSNLKHLEEFYVTNCSSLIDIRGLENLNSIRRINMEGCSSLATSFEQSFFNGYFERGISLNIVLPRTEIPYWVSYQSSGCSICFYMPVDISRKFIGITLWVIYSKESGSVVEDSISAVINNKSRGTKWTYCGFDLWSIGVHSWVRYIPGIYHIMSSGDFIEIFIRVEKSVKVGRCGFHLSRSAWQSRL